MMSRLKTSATLAGALLVAVVGIASAAIPSGDGTIYACYDKQSGQVRLYDPAGNLPKTCGPKEVSVTWNAQGTAGTAGEDGQDGQDGVSGYETVYAESEMNSSNTDKMAVAACPSGKSPLGGGAAVRGPEEGGGQLVVHGVGLVDSRPYSGGWTARAQAFVPADTEWLLAVWAICAVVS